MQPCHFIIVYSSDYRPSVLAAAILDFLLMVQLYNIAFDSIELGNPKNIDFAVETAFLTGLRAEI